jgi:NitT/TauT family transport system permease protein
MLDGKAEGPSRAPGARRALAVGWARGLTGVVIFILVAEAASRLDIISRAALPSIFSVLSQSARLVTSREFTADVWATVEDWALGLAIATAIAVPLGLVLGSLPVVRTATRTIVEFLRPIPSVAIIPLVGLILGAGLAQMMTVIVYAAVWPILFNTIYGLDDVDPMAKDTLRAFGFGRAAVLGRVSLPSAAPFIVTGIRLASSIAIILDVATGILTGPINGPGIGAYISGAATAGNMTLILAATVWAGILGFCLNALILTIEKRVFRWHYAYAEGAR